MLRPKHPSKPRCPMCPRTQESLPSLPSIRMVGFVRHEFYLALAIALLALSLVLPRLFNREWLGALMSLLGLAGVVLAIFGALLAFTWLGRELERPSGGWRSHLGRFLLCGFIGLVIATALEAQHNPGKRTEALIPLSAGLLAGVGGIYLHQRFGESRFWAGFKWFGLALLGSFVGGILGILGPEPWSVNAGILIPLFLFLALALTTHFRRSRKMDPHDSRSQP